MIKKRHIKKFIKLANELDLLIKEIKEYYPTANYYLAMDTLNLMKGESHGGMNQSPLRENVVEGVHIRTLSGGDW